MKTMNCKTCNNCKPVYGREWYWISHIKPKYYCTVCEQLLQREGCCEKWQRKKTEIDISPQRLEEVEQDIKYLIEYFNE